MPVQSICERCGASFVVGKSSTGRFCGRRCANQRQHDAVAHLAHATCGHCGVPFSWSEHPSRPRQFCSQDCARNAKRQPLRRCVNCDKPFKPAIRGKGGETAKFCSMTCRTLKSWTRREKVCAGCGVRFLSRAAPSMPGKFCSRECFLEHHIVGEPHRRARRTLTQSKRRARALGNAILPVKYGEIAQRDRFRCWLCNKKIKRADLHFDHAIPLSRNGEHSTRNIRMTHAICNERKQDRLLTHQPFLL